MDSGDLNKRIDIEAPTHAVGTAFDTTVTWTAVASSIAAAIWPVSASEAISSMQKEMTITHRIRIRYRNTLKPSWRVKFANRYFNIVSILDQNESHVWLDLLCKETA